MSSDVTRATSVFSRRRWPILTFQMAVFLSLFGLNPTSGRGGDGSALRQFVWILLVVVGLLGVTAESAHWQDFKNYLVKKRGSLLLLGTFFALAMLSSLWSEAPFVTFKRAALLGIVFLMAVFAVFTMAINKTPLATALVPPLALLLAISILFTALFPDAAITPLGWQGLTGQKNEMGQLASLLVLASFFLTPQSGYLHRLKSVLIVCGLIALALSRSTTSIMALVLTAGILSIGFWFALLNKHRTWIVPFFLATFALLVALSIALLFDWLPSIAEIRTELFSVIGKSENLTGRTKLWDLVTAQNMFRSEIYGGGYGGFWDISGERILYITRQLGFAPIQAHNGYLDIFNDLGYIGLSLACFILVYYAFNLASGIFGKANAPSPAPKFLFALGIYIFISNFSESSLFRTTQFLNLLFVVSFIYAAGGPARPNRQFKYLNTELSKV